MGTGMHKDKQIYLRSFQCFSSRKLLEFLSHAFADFVVQDGKYAIVTDRWQKFSDVFLDERVLDFLASYADEFLVHGVDVEGKK